MKPKMASVKLQQKVKKDKLKTGKTKKGKKIGLKTVPLKEVSVPSKVKSIKQTEAGAVTKIKKQKYILPSKAVTDDLVVSCLSALEKLAAHPNKKNAIFGDENQIFMEIRCIKIQNTTGNIKFVLPHTTVSSSKEVCLITPDIKKGRKIDHEPTVDKWEEILRVAGVTTVKTVLPMRQLRVEYDQFELKRRLLTQHDFIMVDTRVLNHVSHILGKMFFKKHNMLIPVKIEEKKDIKKSIDIGLRTVMLRVSDGLTSTILVGHTGMPQNEIKENIVALVNKLNEKFPGGEANIRSLGIKLPLSLSLPLYMTLRPSTSIMAPKLKRSKPKSYVMYEDELSTHLNSVVRVNPDGTVKLKLQKSMNRKNGSNIDDENISEDDENISEGNEVPMEDDEKIDNDADVESEEEG